MTRVKICGLKESRHIMAATEAGADYIGLNFVPDSSRYIEKDAALEIVRDYREKHSTAHPIFVGVFANQSLEHVNNILSGCNLDMAQLSGNEPLSFALKVVRPVIKTIRIPINQQSGVDISALSKTLKEFISSNVLCLLDSMVNDHLGGTGKAFDWNIAKILAQKFPFLLAGGLTPKNVAQAISQVNPWGVDVSSGVETNYMKDSAKIAAFVYAAKTCEA